MIYRTNSSSSITVGNSNDTIDLKGSGTRPTYNSNNLALYSDIPTNSDYVDLTTDQNIGGTKTFSNTTNYGANIVFNGSNNSQALTSIINNTQKNLISRNNSASYVYVGNTYDALNLRGSDTRPSYYANGTSKDIAFTDDIPDISNLADKDLSNITTVNTPITTTAINPLINKLTNADITVASSADIDTGILFRDVNDNNLAGFTTTRFTNGVQATAISATNKISGTQKSAYFNIYVNPSGNDIADGSAGVKSTIASWAMPAGTSYPVAFDASGYFTASQNGYLAVSVHTNSPTGFYLNCSSGLTAVYTAPYAGWDVNGFIPLAAWQSVSLYIVDGYLNTGFPKFVPCIGG